MESQAQSSTSSGTLSKGRGGVLGVKAGMTQVFQSNGEAVAVTVIDLAPLFVTQLKTKANDGYSAVQVGVATKKKAANKAEEGHVKKAGQSGFYSYSEFRFDADKDLDGLALGQALSAEFLKPGDFIDLTSVSKGKGFQGVMKRYHYAGGPASHGASVCHRSIGSIGNRADPGKVFKGKRMPGHMGHKKVTVQNVKVVRVDLDKKILLVHGSVPGPKSGIVTIRKSLKKVVSNA